MPIGSMARPTCTCAAVPALSDEATDTTVGNESARTVRPLPIPNRAGMAVTRPSNPADTPGLAPGQVGRLRNQAGWKRLLR